MTFDRDGTYLPRSTYYLGDIAIANDASDQRITFTTAFHRHFNNMLELLPSGTERVCIIVSLSLVFNH